jgi:hypothetical protein
MGSFEFISTIKSISLSTLKRSVVTEPKAKSALTLYKSQSCLICSLYLLSSFILNTNVRNKLILRAPHHNIGVPVVYDQPDVGVAIIGDERQGVFSRNRSLSSMPEYVMYPNLIVPPGAYGQTEVVG